MEPHEYRFNYVNIGLCHQYVISAAEEQVSFLRKIPGGEEMAVFEGVQKHPHNKPSIYIFTFIYTSGHFTPHGRYELNKLTSLPMCGFIAQLVEQRTGNAEVTGLNPVEALIFFLGFFFPIA